MKFVNYLIIQKLIKMTKQKVCPNCKTEIDYLDFDVTGTCSAQIYQSDVLENKETDYDIDCLTDGAEYNNFRCPECGEVIAETEEKAKEFLKNEVKEEDKRLICPNCQNKMEFEEEIIFNGEKYDKWGCEDCSHIIVLDFRGS